MGEKVTPYQASKVVNKLPGHVYHFVKTGKLTTYGTSPTGTVLVDVDEVRNFFEHHFQRTRTSRTSASSTSTSTSTSTSRSTRRPKPSRGDLLTWDKGTYNKKSKGQSFATVLDHDITTDPRSPLVYVQKHDKVEFEFATADLYTRLKDHTVQLLHPVELLELIKLSFELTNQPQELTVAIDNLISACEECYRSESESESENIASVAPPEPVDLEPAASTIIR